jgi:NitT/TauT family transport system substrate-binding protein
MTVNEIKLDEMYMSVMPASLENGKIESYLAWEPYISLAYTHQGSVLLYSDEWWEHHPCCVVVTHDDYIKNKPVELNKFLKVHKESTTFLNNNKNESIEILSKKLSIPYNIEYESYDHIEYVSQVNSTFWEGVYKFIGYQKDLGFIKKNISLSSFDFSHLPN